MCEVCAAHHIAEKLSGSHVSNLDVLPRSSVQSEAVQARVQLFHLFTQESLNVQQPVCTESPNIFHAPALSLTAAVQPRRELFTDFTLSDEKFAVNK